MSLLICSPCEENREPIFNEFQKVQESLGWRLRDMHPRIKSMNGHYDLGSALKIPELYDIKFTFQKAEHSNEYEISFHQTYRSKLRYFNKLLIIDMVNQYVRTNFVTTSEYLLLPKFDNEISVKNEFINNCAKLLHSLNCPEDYATIAAKTLYDRMAVNKLAYHNPIHVMCMFEFAEKHGIILTKQDELAIWFHDAVYDVTLKEGANELASAEFMTGILTPFVNKIDVLNVAYNRILETARHLETTIDSLHNTVLDLDLCSFSFERPIYKKVAGYIRSEYAHVEYDTFKKGRKQFLNALLNKGFIYRSKEFQQFEATAVANIKQDLEELENE